jgi:hypothetical protein
MNFMSLLRLLSAGRSLIGSNNEGIRYRMGEPGALPKFGAKNPFRPKPSKPAVENLPAPKASLSSPVPNPAPASLAPARGAAAPFKTVAAPSWLKKLRGSFSWRRAKAEPRPVPQFGKPAVQGELSLDAVKVVRNDLSDADWEIVPAKPRASQSKLPAPAAGASADFDAVNPARTSRSTRLAEAHPVEVDQS